MKQIDIRKFESLTTVEQINFLENLENIKDYELKKILNFTLQSKNIDLLIESIDLANDYKLANESLLRWTIELFNVNRSYLLKLTILDYLLLYKKRIYKDSNEYEILKRNLIIRNHKIVKIQIIINLIYYNPDDKNIFFPILLKLLKTCLVYQAHIRLYSNLENKKIASMFDKGELLLFIKITESKNFGRAVQIKLKDFKSKIGIHAFV